MSRFSFSPRFAALPVAAVLAAGLFAPAQAAPDPNPPVGYGTADRSRRADRDVLRGTVERTLSSRSFDLRARDGRIYRVTMPFAVGLQNGLNVRVSGDLRGSTFQARVVAISDVDDRFDDGYDDSYNSQNGYPYNGGGNGGGVDNGTPGYGTPGDGRAVILTGRVTRLYSRTEFDVRDDDDGTIYRVITRNPLDTSVRVGDRVQARGDLNGRSIRADYAGEVGVTTGNDRFGKAVDFPATLQSVLLNLGEATVRADNGYTYTIRASRNVLDDFRIGQRVRVRGNFINDVVETASLARIY